MTFTGIDTSDLTRYGPHYTGDGKRYLLRLPAAAKAKGYTRATTFAKTIDDEANIAPWGETMGIVGVLTDTPTRTEWQALLAEHADPWYATAESKQRARDLAAQAKERGGAGDRRDTGTALHTILHLVATGRAKASDVDEEWRPHIVNALAALEQAGLRIVPELCELTVYNRIYDTIGRFDLIVETLDDRYGTTGTLHIGDWKTGGATWRVKKDWKTKRQTGWVDGYDLADGPHCGQLTLYASASDIVVWPENQWDECRLVPMPDIDQTRGFIIHLPSTEPGNVSVRVLNLETGRQWLDTCKLVRETRKCRPLIERVGAIEPPVPEIVPAESLPPRGDLSARTTQPADPFDGIVDGRTDPPAKPERRAWIIRRLEVLKGIDGALSRVGFLWPSGLATLKNSDRHTDRDIDRIVAVLDAVEAEYTVTFGDKDPTIEETPGRWTKTAGPVSALNSATRGASSTTTSSKTDPPISHTQLSEHETTSTESSSNSTPDEGPAADPDAVTTLEQKYHDLPDEARAWIAGIARDAQQAGRPIHLAGTPTIRRFEIVRGLVTLASAGFDEDEIVRGLIELLLGSEFVGLNVYVLDVDDAKGFADLCVAYCAGEVKGTVDNTGRLVFATS